MFRLTLPAFLMVIPIQGPAVAPATFHAALTGLMASRGDSGKVGQSTEPFFIEMASFRKASGAEKDTTLDWSAVATALGDRGSITRSTTCVTCPMVSAGVVAVEGEKLIVHITLTRFYGADPNGRTRISGTEYLVALVKTNGAYRYSGISGMVIHDGIVIPGRGAGG